MMQALVWAVNGDIVGETQAAGETTSMNSSPNDSECTVDLLVESTCYHCGLWS